MKKGVLLNSEISYVISKLGHNDSLVVCDCGLPIPDNVMRIDLAVKKGIPSFMEVLDAVLSEQQVEAVVVAKETRLNSPDIYKEIVDRFNEMMRQGSNEIKLTEVTHEEFKNMTRHTKAVIRTGEFTPYANILLKSGVVF